MKYFRGGTPRDFSNLDFMYESVASPLGGGGGESDTPAGLDKKYSPLSWEFDNFT